MWHCHYSLDWIYLKFLLCLFSTSIFKCHKISCHATKSIFFHWINLLVAKTLNEIYFMVSLLSKYFWLTYHKLAHHTTEYILALDRFCWTTRGAWGPSSKKKLLFFSIGDIIGNFYFVSRCFPGAVGSYYFQDLLPISKYRRCGYVKWRIAIK